MRAFIALELPEDVRRALGAAQCRLAASQADVKWVAVAHLHLTLKFLGEITEEQRAQVVRLLKALASTTAPLRLRFTGLGSFPTQRAPRVLWVGVEDETQQLPRLAAALGRGLASLACGERDERFVAHVTLGRVRSPRNRAGGPAGGRGGEAGRPPRPAFRSHPDGGCYRRADDADRPANRAQLTRQLAEVAWTPPPSFAVLGVTLMQSVLSSTGSTYTPLAQLPFSGQGE